MASGAGRGRDARPRHRAEVEQRRGDLELCFGANAVVISKDSDFIRLLETVGRARLVHVLIGNCSNPHLIARFAARWPGAAAKLSMGERLVKLR